MIVLFHINSKIVSSLAFQKPFIVNFASIMLNQFNFKNSVKYKVKKCQEKEL